MRFLIVFLLGLIVGGALFVVGLIYNPFINAGSVSPLSVTDARTSVLSYSGVAAENIVYSNDGESRVSPHPEKVLQLWEAPVRQSTVMVTTMRDARNQVAGIGIKFSSLSEDTRLLQGEALLDSAWYVYLPGKGSFFVAQRENHWNYLRDIVVAAYRNSTNTWKGSWHGVITSGPGALGTANVSGGSGEFSGFDMLAVESLSVFAWSAALGPISTDGKLTLELPDHDALADIDLDADE